MNRKVIIRDISNAIPGGSLSVITGDGFGNNGLKVSLSPCTGALPGHPALEEAVEDEISIDADIVDATEHTITFQVPEGDYKVWSVKAATSEGESNAYLLNAPVIKWVMNESISPGETFRIFGQALTSIDKYEREDPVKPRSFGGYLEKHGCSVMIKDSGGNYLKAEVIKASSYDVHAVMPVQAGPGECEVYVSNGCGGIHGWSKPYLINVVRKKEWPDTLFNVLDFGAKSIEITDTCYKGFFDNAQAFQAALDAADKNGGGIVFVPNGRYCFKGGLRIPRFTKLAGQDKGRVYFELPTGMHSEDASGGRGWGTVEEGMAITVFIKGEGDFALENLSILAVFTPLIIGAPIIDGIPKIGTNKFNNAPCFGNLMDYDREACDVAIRNCYIIHEPTYMEHSRLPNDPLMDEKLSMQNPESRFTVWTAIAIKGENIEITGNTIEGAGTPVALLGARNSSISNNTLLGGIFGEAIDIFSSSYNPDVKWYKPVRNIVIEDNDIDIVSNLNRSAMWVMESHTHYYVARNKMKPRFWHSDSEGINFHLWGPYLSAETKGGNKELTIVKESLNLPREKLYNAIFDEQGNIWQDAFKNWDCTVVGGKGIGQTREIANNFDNTIILCDEWDCELDETSILSLSEHKKFEHTLLIDNEVDACGRGIYHWGSAFYSIMDGNILSRNSGALMEDLSYHYDASNSIWQFAGHYFNQIINNRLTLPRGFGYNFGVIGVSGGRVAASTVSMIIRGNVAEDDTIIVAKPFQKASDGLNYIGVVIENNLSRNCDIGIMIDENISVALKGNEFENVDKPITGQGVHTKIFRNK